jgi:hypothetical protein
MHQINGKTVLVYKQIINKIFYGLIVVLPGLLCFSFNAQAITGINPSQHPPVELLPLSIAHRINLRQAIDMVLKTAIGQQFKPDIAELAKQGKIRLTPLNAEHYGESGEGCVIRDGQYHYEGFFIVLNEALSIPELASALIHEADHYSEIKRINREKAALPVKIGWLESSAFATQLDFIEALEAQGLSDRKALFVNRGNLVFEVMAVAQAYKIHPTEQTYTAVIDELVEFGYPQQELERTLVVKDQAHCKGVPTSDKAQVVK